MSIQIDEGEAGVISKLNAAGAHISGALIDKIGGLCQRTTRDRYLRFRSHPLQASLYTSTGACFIESQGKRTTSLGFEWTTDGTLPLTVVVIEGRDGREIGQLENLYPTCPVCMERRVQEAVQSALESKGLLKPRLRAPLIQVEGKPVSETLIEDRG